MTISILSLGWDSKSKNKMPIAATRISSWLSETLNTGITAPMVGGDNLNNKSTSIIQIIEMLNTEEIEIMPTSSLRKSKKDSSLISADLDTYKYLIFRKLIKGEKFVSRTRSPMFYTNEITQNAELVPCGTADKSDSYEEFVALYRETCAEARQYMTGNDLKVSLIDPIIKKFKFESLGVGNYTKLLEFEGDLQENAEWCELTELIKIADNIMAGATLRPTIISGEFLVLQEEKPFLKGASNLIEKILSASNVGQNNHERLEQAESAIKCAKKIRSTIEAIEEIKFSKLENKLQDARDHILALEAKKASKKTSKISTSKNRIIADQAAQLELLMAKIAALEAQAAFNQG